jgi:hypothetical protein
MLDSRAVNFSHSFSRILLRACFLNIGFCTIIFGIFFHSQPSGERETLWIVDTSLSMAVEDITHSQHLSSSRLDLAKALIASGVVHIPGQHALMTFSDIARLQVPLTSDRDFIGLTLRTLSPRLYGA